MRRAFVLVPWCSLLWLGCATSVTPSQPPPPGDPITDGKAAVGRRGCPFCHDPGDGSLSGQSTPRPGTMAYGANLTPDEETGLGGWSDDEVVRAIRTGVDDEHQPLCPPMPRFSTMDDAEVRAIVAYLRSLPPVHNDAIPESVCPPLKGGGDDGEDGGPPVDALAPVADAGAPDEAEPIDLAPAAVDQSPPPPDLSDCGPRIDEVQTAGSAGAEDEFVEIVNPCGAAIAVDGWTLVYRSASGTSDVPLVALSGALAPGRHLVCGGKSYSGAADLRYLPALSSAGGGLALRDPTGAARDALGWGTATCAFVDGAPAPAPPAGRSIARHPDGADSGDDATDFRVGAPTPGAINP